MAARRFFRRFVLGMGMGAALMLTPGAEAQDAKNLGDGIPTPQQYVTNAGGDSKVLAPGEFKLDGRRQVCGQRPTVIDNKLDDYGAAYPGFIIMNPRYLAKVSTPVKQWIYAHECGHQFRGQDEETADCFAVQRGRRQGWLTPEVSKRFAPSSRPPRAMRCTSPGPTVAPTCASATKTQKSASGVHSAGIADDQCAGPGDRT